MLAWMSTIFSEILNFSLESIFHIYIAKYAIYSL